MDIKKLSQLIRDRRAMPPRFFNKNKVGAELIEQILENANWAPNHKKSEPWRFIIFRGESKSKLAQHILDNHIKDYKAGVSVNPEKAEKFKANADKSDAIITIIMERDTSGRLPEWEDIAAVSCAVQNMWLSATAMGLSAFWSTPAFIETLGDYLGLSPNQRCLGFLHLGYSDIDLPSPGRGSVEEKTKWMD
ncbi:nitroreductase [Puteibacter caeruleilacunae]|nr:nitroreductase [Puteibacter caeruleilacunae]